MKILHVIDSLDLYRGGPSVCVPSIAAAQAEKGSTVYVISYELGDERQFNQFLAENVPGYNNVEFIYIKPGGCLEKYFALEGKRGLREAIKSVDIVHVHGIWHPLLQQACQLAATSNTKYVITLHGMLDPWSLSQKRFKKYIAMRVKWRHILEHSYFIHALNVEERKLIRPLNIKSDIKIISNGVFRKVFEDLPSDTIFRRNHPELGGKEYVLFLSRLHYKKGLDYLIDAFGMLKDKYAGLDLVIAGPDDGAEKSSADKANEKGLAVRVHFVGPLYNAEKYSAYAGAACFCLPSRQEGFSIAITEALACGTPVVISEQCNFTEVTDNNAGFVVQLEVCKIAKAIDKLLSDRAASEVMGYNARSLVLNNYTWDVVAEKMLYYYSH